MRSWIRATYPYGFRAGEWANLLGHQMVDGQECWHVVFDDGAEDFWPMKDEMDPYEFRHENR